MFIFFSIFMSHLYAINCDSFSDFESYNGHYYAITKEKYTFGQAKQLAEQNSAYVAIPNDAGENSFLESKFGISWIGIWDSSYPTSICSTLPCPINASRFSTVKGQALTYSNWGNDQPDNYASVYDINRVSILGEHFTVLTQNGYWASEGDHYEDNNYPKKYKAIFEWDTKPECVNEPATNSQVIDIVNHQVCSNGTDMNLSECVSGNYDAIISCSNGGTLSGSSCSYSASCPSGSNLPSDCSGNYPNTWLKNMYTSLLNRCPDQSGYNYWLSDINQHGYTSPSQIQTPFCVAAQQNNEPCGSATPNQTMCYGTTLQNVTVQQPVTTTTPMQCPNGGTLSGTTCNNTCSNVSYSCPNGGTLSGTTCQKTCSSTVNQTCYDICSWYASSVGYGGVSYHGIMGGPVCGTPWTDHWGDGRGDIYGGSCGSTWTVSSTSTTDCSYPATATTTSTYDCSYSASCPSGSNLPSDCSGNYPNTWLKNMYTSLLNRCPDQSGYNYWLSDINQHGYTSPSQIQTPFCVAAQQNNEPCGSATPNQTMCYGTTLQNVTVQQPVTTTTPMQCPNGGTLSGTTSNTCSYNATLGCPNGGSLSGTTCQNGTICPIGNYQCISNAQVENTEVTVSDSKDQGFQNDGSCAGQIRLFNGKNMQCRKSDTLFGLLGGGCCKRDTPNGLGGLFNQQCNEDEKVLSKYRKETQDKSYFLGEYCSKKVKLGFAKICVQKKESYCVFNSKLARIIQVQGRTQLGIEWGSATSPNCKGFTPEEFQKIDFSKLDLSEFYGDLQSKIQTNIDTNIGPTIQQKVNSFGSVFGGNN